MKILGNILDVIISIASALLFFGWVFGFVKVYQLFNKIFIVIG